MTLDIENIANHIFEMVHPIYKRNLNWAVQIFMGIMALEVGITRNLIKVGPRLPGTRVK